MDCFWHRGQALVEGRCPECDGQLAATKGEAATSTRSIADDLVKAQDEGAL